MAYRTMTGVFLAASLLSSVAAAQAMVYFHVEIGAPNGSAPPSVVVRPPTAPSVSLADRTTLQAMWNGMAFQMTPIARECAMPVAVEIDASSFAGRFVPGTDDGLQPGTRSRFRDFARAVTAVCHRGATEQAAVRGRVRTIRFGFTESATDRAARQGDTLVFYTNGDMGGASHLGYARMIDAITHML